MGGKYAKPSRGGGNDPNNTHNNNNNNDDENVTLRDSSLIGGADSGAAGSRGTFGCFRRDAATTANQRYPMSSSPLTTKKSTTKTKSSSMRQSASCDANMTFMTRVRRWRLFGSAGGGSRPRSALVETTNKAPATTSTTVTTAVVPRSATDHQLIELNDDHVEEDDNDEHEELLRDVRDKLIAIQENRLSPIVAPVDDNNNNINNNNNNKNNENYQDDDEDRSLYDVDDDEDWPKQSSNKPNNNNNNNNNNTGGHRGFERVGCFAKSPAIYNFQDVNNDNDDEVDEDEDDDDEDLQISLSSNSTLSDAEASISSSLTPTPPSPPMPLIMQHLIQQQHQQIAVAVPQPPSQQIRPASPSPAQLPPAQIPRSSSSPPLQSKQLVAQQSQLTKKPSLLDRLARRFLHLKTSRPQKLLTTSISAGPITSAPAPPTIAARVNSTHASSSSSSSSSSSARLSLSDGLIYIDDDPDLAKLPAPYYVYFARRRSYFVEMERTSIAMEQRCLRDNDSISLNDTISYVVPPAPLAQSENSTLANDSRDNLSSSASRPLPHPPPLRHKNNNSYRLRHFFTGGNQHPPHHGRRRRSSTSPDKNSFSLAPP